MVRKTTTWLSKVNVACFLTSSFSFKKASQKEKKVAGISKGAVRWPKVTTHAVPWKSERHYCLQGFHEGNRGPH